MNRDMALKSLIALLADFQYHMELLHEITTIIKESGYEAKLFRLLLARLKFLNEHRIQAHEYHQEFERLNRNIYSMHLAKKEFNIRILYSFDMNNRPVLLVPFYERAGKRKTDYTPYISIAEARLIEFMKEVIE